MRKLNKPMEDMQVVYSTCISKVREPALKRRLELCENDVLKASKDYEKYGASDLYKFKTHAIVGVDITTEEMGKVYTIRMAKKGRPGRKYYDKLMGAPVSDICPLCAQRPVSTLDHYLPKALYPVLSVVLLNLVPACKDCNLTKLDYEPKSSEETTIHPYYDNIDTEQWLYAEINDSSPFFRFYVSCPNTWDSVLQKRVERHFTLFDLNTLYCIHASVEVGDIVGTLDSILNKKGASDVIAHLQDGARSRRKAHTNSWRTALYEAMSTSDWFCNGGFNDVKDNYTNK